MNASASERDTVADRQALVASGVCLPAHPGVTVELYGSLRLKTGRDQVPMRADTIGTALAVLRRALPQAERLLPRGPALAENFRFSVNGRSVTTDLATELLEGDRVIVFSASVGG
jgi:molybdopterin converting factor small subunit